MLITLTHCSACHALVNPAWGECFVCGCHVNETAQAATPPVEVVQQTPTLAEAYERYWNTPESVTMETFQALHREIDIEERQVGVETAWRTLEEAARAWHQEKGTCPFCKLSGVLHLATETV